MEVHVLYREGLVYDTSIFVWVPLFFSYTKEGKWPRGNIDNKIESPTLRLKEMHSCSWFYVLFFMSDAGLVLFYSFLWEFGFVNTDVALVLFYLYFSAGLIFLERYLQEKSKWVSKWHLAQILCCLLLRYSGGKVKKNAS